MKKSRAQLFLLSGDFIDQLYQSYHVQHLLMSSMHVSNHRFYRTCKTNMRVHLQNDGSPWSISKHLLYLGNGKTAIDEPCQEISVKSHTATPDNLQQGLPNKARKYRNRQWLSARKYRNRQWLSARRAILAAINNDVNTINFSIQNGIPGDTTTYKSFDVERQSCQLYKFPKNVSNYRFVRRQINQKKKNKKPQSSSYCFIN